MPAGECGMIDGRGISNHPLKLHISSTQVQGSSISATVGQECSFLPHTSLQIQNRKYMKWWVATMLLDRKITWPVSWPEPLVASCAEREAR